MSEEYELIHDAVRLDPERVWDALARFLADRLRVHRATQSRSNGAT